jgi:hypothetical protein
LFKISSIFASRPYRAAAVRGEPTQAKAWACVGLRKNFLVEGWFC